RPGREGVAAEGERRDVLDSLRTARELEVVHEDVEDEDERDRDERQVVTARLEDRHEEERAHGDRHPRPDQHGEPRRPAPGERRAEPWHEPHERACRDERPARGPERPRALGEDGGDHECEDGRLGQPDARQVAAHTRSTLLSPRRPLGLNTRNSMTTANATTSRNSEPRGMSAAAVVWSTPKSKPPRIAP